MAAIRPVAVLCRIFPAGFSGERIVKITKADGTEHVSLAPRHYCWRADRTPLDLNEPGDGQSIDGMVAARLLQESGATSIVSLPDGDVIPVEKARCVQRPEETHVSV